MTLVVGKDSADVYYERITISQCDNQSIRAWYNMYRIDSAYLT